MHLNSKSFRRQRSAKTRSFCLSPCHPPNRAAWQKNLVEIKNGTHAPATMEAGWSLWKEKRNQHQHERKNTVQYTKVYFVPTSQRIFWRFKKTHGNDMKRWNNPLIPEVFHMDHQALKDQHLEWLEWISSSWLGSIFFNSSRHGQVTSARRNPQLGNKNPWKKQTKTLFWWLFAWIFLERVDFLFVNLPWIRNLIMQKSANNLFIDADSLGLLFAFSLLCNEILKLLSVAIFF